MLIVDGEKENLRVVFGEVNRWCQEPCNAIAGDTDKYIFGYAAANNKIVRPVKWLMAILITLQTACWEWKKAEKNENLRISDEDL